MHLREVAVMARRFAEVFKDDDLAYLIGLTHDLGKRVLHFSNILLPRPEAKSVISAHMPGQELLYFLTIVIAFRGRRYACPLRDTMPVLGK